MNRLDIRYAVVKLASFESGKLFISPQLIRNTEQQADDYAQFSSQAYREPYVVVEMRVSSRVG